MPTYQYACTACEHRFEVVQSFSESSLTECPECAGRLRKLYGSVGVVFKGSGFYRTDSRKAEKADAMASSSESSSGSSDTSSTSSDAKKTDAKKTDSKKPESNSSANTTGTTSPAKIAS